MSPASNTFEQWTCVHNYSDDGSAEKPHARPSNEQSILSQQNIEEAQK